jgi:hypothetical protein
VSESGKIGEDKTAKDRENSSGNAWGKAGEKMHREGIVIGS